MVDLAGAQPARRVSNTRTDSSTPSGLAKVGLKAGADGQAKVLVNGSGESLALAPLPLTPTVTVQLKNTETGVCWSAEYSNPSTNDTGQFKAKSD